jgi:hypothetical protein
MLLLKRFLYLFLDFRIHLPASRAFVSADVWAFAPVMGFSTKAGF